MLQATQRLLQAQSLFLLTDQPEIFKVSIGEKVASIGSANVFVTEMSG